MQTEFQTSQLPLFPLPIFIFPDGINQLRVFEPRYQRLVKIASRNELGFGVCMEDKGIIARYGTRVFITDFESLPDHTLGITIQGIESFEIIETWIEKDHLQFGTINPIIKWCPVPATSDNVLLVDTLKQVFLEFPQLSEHYILPMYDDITWVCQRWLEILPLPLQHKQWLLSQNDSKKAIQFLHTVIQNLNSSH